MDFRKDQEWRRLFLCRYFYEKGGGGRKLTTRELVGAMMAEQRRQNGGLLLPQAPGARHRLSNDRLDATMSNLEKSVFESLRKRLYKDVDALITAGLPIKKAGARNSSCYIWDGSAFDENELALLVDIVSSCSFLTKGRAENLVAKVRRISSAAYDCDPSPEVRYVYEDEALFESFDAIREAMRKGRHVGFKYGYLRDYERFELNKDGKRDRYYVLFPVDLYLADGFYYMVASNAKTGDFASFASHRSEKLDSTFRVFRVDRMREAEVRIRKRPLEGARAYYDSFLKDARKFGQGFAGAERSNAREVAFSIRADKNHIVVDQFGEGVTLEPAGERTRFHVKLKPSEQFFGWVAGLGGLLKIEGPASVIDEYRAFLEKELANYATDLDAPNAIARPEA